MLGLGPQEAARIGPARAARVRTFRLLHHLGQQLHFLADHLYRADGVTAQQAMLLGIVEMLGTPSLTEVASVFATSHQNVKQIATALARKGLVTLRVDPRDARVRRLRTTAKNARFWAARDKGDFEVVSEWFSALTTSEVEQLLQLLLKLHIGVRASVQRARAGERAEEEP